MITLRRVDIVDSEGRTKQSLSAGEIYGMWDKLVGSVPWGAPGDTFKATVQVLGEEWAIDPHQSEFFIQRNDGDVDTFLGCNNRSLNLTTSMEKK